MRTLSAVVLALAVAASGATTPAVAAGPLEPGLSLRIPFGGARPAPVQFSARLDYARPFELAADELTLPVALEWRLDGTGHQALYGNGLLLGSGRSWRSDATESGEESSWGWNIGTILLAGGAALALVVVVAGETAEDMQDGSRASFDGSDVDLEEDDGVDECEVPVPENPSADGCVFDP